MGSYPAFDVPIMTAELPFRVVAPDFPGFGLTREIFFFLHLGIKQYSMYVMDYGAPVGYRLATK